jgi:uncharacterized protein YkwD
MCPRTITFEANEGDGTKENIFVKGNTELALPNNTFSKSNHTFEGWATTQEGAEEGLVDFTEGATIKTAENKTLWAVWQHTSQFTVNQNYINRAEAEFLRLVNNERERLGRRALTTHHGLADAAERRAIEPLSPSHTRPDGRASWTALADSGYQRPGGWNGMVSVSTSTGPRGSTTTTTPESVAAHAFNWWMNSTVHRENLLSASARYIGIGITPVHSYAFLTENRPQR